MLFARGLQFRRRPVGAVALVVVVGEFVVVPGADERPARSRRLQVGIGQVGFVQVSVVLQGHREAVAVGDLAVREGRHLARQGPATAALVPAALVDEISQVQHELDLVLLGCRAVVRQHACPGGVEAVLEILAADEGQPDIALRAGRGGRAGAPGARAGTAPSQEAVVVDAVGLQSIDIGTHGVIAVWSGSQLYLQQQLGEVTVTAQLQYQRHTVGTGILFRQRAGPEHDGVRLRVPRGDALGKAEPGRVRGGPGGKPAAGGQEKGTAG